MSSGHAHHGATRCSWCMTWTDALLRDAIIRRRTRGHCSVECRDAHVAAALARGSQAWIGSRRPTPQWRTLTTVHHGRRKSYDLGCRCAPCRGANASRERHNRRQRNARS